MHATDRLLAEVERLHRLAVRTSLHFRLGAHLRLQTARPTDLLRQHARAAAATELQVITPERKMLNDQHNYQPCLCSLDRRLSGSQLRQLLLQHDHLLQGLVLGWN